MGKRSNFKRKKLDKYYTPHEAVLPLLAHLDKATRFIEPCAGDGRLVRHLEQYGHECIYACDIEPVNDNNAILHIEQQDVLFFGAELPTCEMIITNPPWSRDTLHQMIDTFRNHAPTWLLFDAAWMFTAQAKAYLPYCAKIATIGRISWEGNGVKGMDDCAWYLFQGAETETRFYGL